MNKKIISEIEKLKREREVFVEFVNKLDKWVMERQITMQERDIHVKELTKGSTPKSYIQDMNRKISELEERQSTKPKQQDFRYTKPVAVSAAIMIVFLIGFYAFLGPTITGLFALEDVKEYNLSIEKTFNEDSIYELDIIGITNNTQNITSMKIVGNYYGQFAVYLISEKNEEKTAYRIYSSEDIGSLYSITGLATGGESDIVIPEIITPEENTQESSIKEDTQTDEIIIEETITEEMIAEEPVDNSTDIPIDSSTGEQIDATPDQQQTPIEETNETPVEETNETLIEVPVEIPEEIIEETIPETTEDVPKTIEDIPEMTEDDMIFFNKECIETCDIELSPEGLMLFIEIGENSSLNIEEIILSQRTEPTLIDEVINETIINETIINETIINETIILNETINQTMDIAKIDPELLNAFKSKEKVRVIIKKNGELQTIYVGQKGKQKEKKNPILLTQKEEIPPDDIRTRYPLANNFTDAQIKYYEGKRLLDKNTKRPIEIEQETIDVIASTMDISQLTELSLMPEIEFMTIDKEFSALTTESMNITKIIDAQQLGYSGEGIKVCILDTGLNPDILGIDPQKVNGYNFINDNEDYSDNNGHGTKVVYPLITSAPGINLIIAKVISDSGVGYASDIIAGIEYCQLQNASIISASIGGGGFNGYCDEDFVASKINDIATSSNILTIASTGNDGNELVKSPACARNALAVASSTKNNTLASFSNYNGATLLLAPGENIQTTDTTGNIIIESGTSMSVPFVTATAAMMLQNETLNSSELKWRIIHTGEIIEHPIAGMNNTFRRFSILNAYNAVMNNITNELTEENALVAVGQAGEFTTLTNTSFRNPTIPTTICIGQSVNWLEKDYIDDPTDDTYAYTDTELSGSIIDKYIYLYNNSLIGNNLAVNQHLDKSEQAYYFGGSTTTWGASLTNSIVNSANFGAAIAFYDEGYDYEVCYIIGSSYGFSIPAGATINGVEMYTEYFFDEKTLTINIDGIQLKVYYSESISPKGNQYSWSWTKLDGLGISNKIISGSPYDWNWTIESAGSGRKIRNGTAYNWDWINE